MSERTSDSMPSSSESSAACLRRLPGVWRGRPATARSSSSSSSASLIVDLCCHDQTYTMSNSGTMPPCGTPLLTSSRTLADIPGAGLCCYSLHINRRKRSEALSGSTVGTIVKRDVCVLSNARRLKDAGSKAIGQPHATAWSSMGQTKLPRQDAASICRSKRHIDHLAVCTHICPS